MQMFFRLLFQMRRLNVQERTFRQPLLDAETGNEHRFRPLAQFDTLREAVPICDEVLRR